MIKINVRNRIKAFILNENVIFAILFLFIISVSTNLFKRNKILIDAPSYYLYLPATFIYKDISLKYIDSQPEYLSDLTFYNETTDGKKIIKHTMGVSVMLCPFFLMAHFITILFDLPQTGYTLLYQNIMLIGTWLYILIAIYLLQKILIKYFNRLTVFLTIISILIGTNLLWYITHEPFMSHSFAFSLLCTCIFCFYKWLDEDGSKYLYLFILFFSIAILVRPLLILSGIYFLFIGFQNKEGMRRFFQNINKYPFAWLKITFIIFIIIFPQLLYYKYITGSWFYSGYINEPFLWTKPEIINFLFSFQKGWFIYTPIMIFIIIGFLKLYYQSKKIFYSILPFLLLHIYLLSAWWAWNYQASFGMRSMIEYYSILSFPLAAGYSFFLESRKYLKLSLYFLLVLVISLNLFQTWQYKYGLLHNEFMTREAYFKGFFQTKPSNEWYDLLKAYNYDLRKKGLSQVEMNKKYFQNLSGNELVYFRSSYNLNFISIDNRYLILECNTNSIDKTEVFYFIKLGGDTIALKTLDNKFISYKPEYNNLFIADKDVLGQNEKFILSFIKENDNKILLKTLNGQNLAIVTNGNNNLLMARFNKASKESVFRIYHLYQL